MVVACMVLPSLLINMAVPVNFFHLDRALGSGGPLLAVWGVEASPLTGGGAATPPLLAVTATVGTTGSVAVAKMVIVVSQKSVS